MRNASQSQSYKNAQKKQDKKQFKLSKIILLLSTLGSTVLIARLSTRSVSTCLQTKSYQVQFKCFKFRNGLWIQSKPLTSLDECPGLSLLVKTVGNCGGGLRALSDCRLPKQTQSHIGLQGLNLITCKSDNTFGMVNLLSRCQQIMCNILSTQEVHML